MVVIMGNKYADCSRAPKRDENDEVIAEGRLLTLESEVLVPAYRPDKSAVGKGGKPHKAKAEKLSAEERGQIAADTLSDAGHPEIIFEVLSDYGLRLVSADARSDGGVDLVVAAQIVDNQAHGFTTETALMAPTIYEGKRDKYVTALALAYKRVATYAEHIREGTNLRERTWAAHEVFLSDRRAAGGGVEQPHRRDAPISPKQAVKHAR